LIQTFIEERTQEVERNELQPASLVDIQHFLKRFSREFGDRAVDRVTAGEIDHFLDGMKGIANRRSHRLYISAFFNWAVAQGQLALNPVKLTRRVTKRSQAPKRYSVAEVEQIMNAAPSKLVPYLALGLFSGMRSSEILKLQWCDVDFDQEEIRVLADHLGAQGRIVRLKPNLVKFLLPFRDEDQALVVPHGLRSLQRWVKKLHGELGIKAILQGMRHTFTAFHLAVHPLEETMHDLGYADTVNLFKYCRGTAVDRQQAEAYFEILPQDQGEIIPLKKEAA
jgi:integrase